MSVWPEHSLGEILVERKEVPTEDDLVTGRTRIVSKIRFASGRIELRTQGQTKTGMILVRPGDLLVSGINAAKGAIAIHDPAYPHPIAATIHYGVYVVRQDRADLRFVWWLLRSQAFREILELHVPGGIKTELKASRLLRVPVPLPPLAEQRRIVERIEELARKIEEARGLRRAAAEEAEAIFASEINLLAEQVDSSGHLGDVLSARPRNGWSARCDNLEGGTPILSLGAVTGYQYRPTEHKRTSEPTAENAHYWLRSGDLLITRSNTPELVGHVAIYDGNPFPCIYPDLMMRLEVDQRVADTRFVHVWLQTPLVRDYIRAKAKGTSPSMKKISQSVVMDIPFPSGLSLDEQAGLVAHAVVVQERVSLLRRLQAETEAELEALLPAVLERAFRGEL